MFRKTFSMITFVLTGTLSQAQVSSSNTYQAPAKVDAFKITVLKPMLVLDVEQTTTDLGNTLVESDSSSDGRNASGFAIGYANLPNQEIGFIGQISFINVDGEEGSKDFDLTRMEGNAAFAINERWHVKGGINFTTASTQTNVDLDGSFGYQVGIGFKVNTYLGFDFSYGQMNLKSKMSGDDGFGIEIEQKAELAFKGFELGLTGTF